MLEFRQRWQPIGQSPGDIVYSLPLAPGESLDLAMIDSSRADSFARLDTTDLSVLIGAIGKGRQCARRSRLGNDR